MKGSRVFAAALAFAIMPVTAFGAAPPIPPPSTDVVDGTPVVQQLDTAAPLAGVTLLVRP